MVYWAWGVETVLVCMVAMIATAQGGLFTFRAYLAIRLLVTAVRLAYYPDHSWLIYWPTFWLLFAIAVLACREAIVQRWYSIPAGFAVHYGAALALHPIPNYSENIVALKLIPPILALMVWLRGETDDLYPHCRAKC